MNRQAMINGGGGCGNNKPQCINVDFPPEITDTLTSLCEKLEEMIENQEEANSKKIFVGTICY